MNRTLKTILQKTPKAVSTAVGGRDLVDYAGSKIAKARAPKSRKKYVEDKTSKAKAAKSAGNVAASIIGIATMGGAGSAKLAAKGGKKLLKKGATTKKGKYLGSFKTKGSKKKTRVYQQFAESNPIAATQYKRKFKSGSWSIKK